MLPPKSTQPISKEKLSAEFQGILKRLESTFGAGLRVTVLDPEWVEVGAAALPAPQLLAQIQTKRMVLFGAADSRMQVIQQLTPTGTATYLHMLNAPNWANPGAEALRGKGHLLGTGTTGTSSAMVQPQAQAGASTRYAAIFGKK